METPPRVKQVSFHEVTCRSQKDKEKDLFITKNNEILESDTSSDESEFSEVIAKKQTLTKAIKKRSVRRKLRLGKKSPVVVEFRCN
jgi:hypothetical protein